MRLSPADRKDLLALVESGLSRGLVADLFGVTRSRVSQLVKQARVLSTAPAPQTPPPAPAAAASRRTVTASPPNPRRCTTAGCRGPKQPGRDLCAGCLAETLAANRRAKMV